MARAGAPQNETLANVCESKALNSQSQLFVSCHFNDCLFFDYL